MLRHTEVNQTQEQSFAQSVCDEFMVDINSLVIVKYEMQEIKQFKMTSTPRNPKIIKIASDKVELVALEDEEFETESVIDTLAAPMEIIEEFYTPSEVTDIIANREFVEGLEYNPDIPISLPFTVVVKKMPAIGTRKIENVVDTIYPL